MKQKTPTWKELPAKGIILLLTVFILLSTSGCSLAETRLLLCWRFSNKPEQLLHSHPSPDGTYVVDIVKDPCGGIDSSGKYQKCSTHFEVASYRSLGIAGVCDMQVNWLNNKEFELILPNGTSYTLDVRRYDSSLP